jgi:glyoxylase I family protein
MTHIGICVADLEKSLRFYRDLLGFGFRSDLHLDGEPGQTLLRLPGAKLHAVYLERDGTRLELLAFAAPSIEGGGEPRTMNQRGLTHLSLRVDDLDDTLATMRAEGIRVLDESEIRPGGNTAAIFVCDPDGTLIELVQSPGDLEAPPLSTKR